MILLRNLALWRGPHRLIEGASLTLERGWKVGFVGPNGSGKTSLLALLAGELSPDAGDCEIQPGTRIAAIRQEAPALAQRVLDYLLDADAALRAAEREIVAAEGSGNGERIAAAHEHYAHAGGYTAQARAQSVLAGLGFRAADAQREVREFSGGYRMRLNLGRALLQPSDLLLLDEPTNHLDLDTILWLENWLRGYAGMLIVVSHDRDFLDRATERTLAIHGTQLRLYAGAYSQYELQRATELEHQQALSARQEKEIQRIVSFVERFRAKASKARQAQSRLKSLERMARVAPLYAAETFRFQFEAPARQPERIVELDEAAAGYGGQAVIGPVSLAITRADRLAIIGANGAGKTTLLRLLAGELAPLSGERRTGRDIVIGYFAQHQVEMLRADETPLAMLKRLFAAEREQQLRDFLGRFGFAGERAERPIGPLSGGEKARLALAALVKRRPNLLLLDEPTNHLDLEMRKSLALALQGYEGALLLVAHDRSLLASCADRILVVEDGRLRELDGDLEDYRQLRLKQARAAQPATDKPNRRVARRGAAETRAGQQRLLRPHLREIEKIEARMAALTREAQAAREALAEPSLYDGTERRGDGAGRSARIRELTITEARLTEALAQSEEDWLHASARLEAARTALAD
jgi:ATP-binding cassette subfamily F protein 3